MGGFNIHFQVGVAQLLQMTHGGAEIVVPAFKAGAAAMEKLGRHGEKSLAREALGDVANMRVDAESFLHHQKTARWRRARGRATYSRMDVPSLTLTVTNSLRISIVVLLRISAELSPAWGSSGVLCWAARIAHARRACLADFVNAAKLLMSMTFPARRLTPRSSCSFHDVRGAGCRHPSLRFVRSR